MQNHREAIDRIPGVQSDAVQSSRPAGQNKTFEYRSYFPDQVVYTEQKYSSHTSYYLACDDEYATINSQNQRLGKDNASFTSPGHSSKPDVVSTLPKCKPLVASYEYSPSGECIKSSYQQSITLSASDQASDINVLRKNGTASCPQEIDKSSSEKHKSHNIIHRSPSSSFVCPKCGLGFPCTVVKCKRSSQPPRVKREPGFPPKDHVSVSSVEEMNVDKTRTFSASSSFSNKSIFSSPPRNKSAKDVASKLISSFSNRTSPKKRDFSLKKIFNSPPKDKNAKEFISKLISNYSKSPQKKLQLSPKSKILSKRTESDHIKKLDLNQLDSRLINIAKNLPDKSDLISSVNQNLKSDLVSLRDPRISRGRDSKSSASSPPIVVGKPKESNPKSISLSQGTRNFLNELAASSASRNFSCNSSNYSLTSVNAESSKSELPCGIRNETKQNYGSKALRSIAADPRTLGYSPVKDSSLLSPQDSVTDIMTETVLSDKRHPNQSSRKSKSQKNKSNSATSVESGSVVNKKESRQKSVKKSVRSHVKNVNVLGDKFKNDAVSIGNASNRKTELSIVDNDINPQTNLEDTRTLNAKKISNIDICDSLSEEYKSSATKGPVSDSNSEGSTSKEYTQFTLSDSDNAHDKAVSTQGGCKVIQQLPASEVSLKLAAKDAASAKKSALRTTNSSFNEDHKQKFYGAEFQTLGKIPSVTSKNKTEASKDSNFILSHVNNQDKKSVPAIDFELLPSKIQLQNNSSFSESSEANITLQVDDNMINLPDPSLINEEKTSAVSLKSFFKSSKVELSSSSGSAVDNSMMVETDLQQNTEKNDNSFICAERKSESHLSNSGKPNEVPMKTKLMIDPEGLSILENSKAQSKPSENNLEPVTASVFEVTSSFLLDESKPNHEPVTIDCYNSSEFGKCTNTEANGVPLKNVESISLDSQSRNDKESNMEKPMEESLNFMNNSDANQNNSMISSDASRNAASNKLDVCRVDTSLDVQSVHEEVDVVDFEKSQINYHASDAISVHFNLNSVAEMSDQPSEIKNTSELIVSAGMLDSFESSLPPVSLDAGAANDSVLAEFSCDVHLMNQLSDSYKLAVSQAKSELFHSADLHSVSSENQDSCEVQSRDTAATETTDLLDNPASLINCDSTKVQLLNTSVITNTELLDNSTSVDNYVGTEVQVHDINVVTNTEILDDASLEIHDSTKVPHLDNAKVLEYHNDSEAQIQVTSANTNSELLDNAEQFDNSTFLDKYVGTEVRVDNTSVTTNNEELDHATFLKIHNTKVQLHNAEALECHDDSEAHINGTNATTNIELLDNAEQCDSSAPLDNCVDTDVLANNQTLDNETSLEIHNTKVQLNAEALECHDDSKAQINDNASTNSELLDNAEHFDNSTLLGNYASSEVQLSNSLTANNEKLDSTTSLEIHNNTQVQLDDAEVLEYHDDSKTQIHDINATANIELLDNAEQSDSSAPLDNYVGAEVLANNQILDNETSLEIHNTKVQLNVEALECNDDSEAQIKDNASTNSELLDNAEHFNNATLLDNYASTEVQVSDINLTANNEKLDSTTSLEIHNNTQVQLLDNAEVLEYHDDSEAQIHDISTNTNTELIDNTEQCDNFAPLDNHVGNTVQVHDTSATENNQILDITSFEIHDDSEVQLLDNAEALEYHDDTEAQIHGTSATTDIDLLDNAEQLGKSASLENNTSEVQLSLNAENETYINLSDICLSDNPNNSQNILIIEDEDGNKQTLYLVQDDDGNLVLVDGSTVASLEDNGGCSPEADTNSATVADDSPPLTADDVNDFNSLTTGGDSNKSLDEARSLTTNGSNGESVQIDAATLLIANSGSSVDDSSILTAENVRSAIEDDSKSLNSKEDNVKIEGDQSAELESVDESSNQLIVLDNSSSLITHDSHVDSVVDQKNFSSTDIIKTEPVGSAQIDFQTCINQSTSIEETNDKSIVAGEKEHDIDIELFAVNVCHSSIFQNASNSVPLQPDNNINSDSINLKANITNDLSVCPSESEKVENFTINIEQELDKLLTAQGIFANSITNLLTEQPSEKDSEVETKSDPDNFVLSVLNSIAKTNESVDAHADDIDTSLVKPLKENNNALSTSVEILEHKNNSSLDILQNSLSVPFISCAEKSLHYDSNLHAANDKNYFIHHNNITSESVVAEKSKSFSVKNSQKARKSSGKAIIPCDFLLSGEKSTVEESCLPKQIQTSIAAVQSSESSLNQNNLTLNTENTDEAIHSIKDSINISPENTQRSKKTFRPPNVLYRSAKKTCFGHNSISEQFSAQKGVDELILLEEFSAKRKSVDYDIDPANKRSRQEMLESVNKFSSMNKTVALKTFKKPFTAAKKSVFGESLINSLKNTALKTFVPKPFVKSTALKTVSKSMDSKLFSVGADISSENQALKQNSSPKINSGSKSFFQPEVCEIRILPNDYLKRASSLLLKWKKSELEVQDENVSDDETKCNSCCTSPIKEIMALKTPCSCSTKEVPCICNNEALQLTCEAQDSIDNNIVSCSQSVSQQYLLTPSSQIKHRAFCDFHLWRLRQHHCCPKCGLFCTQGEFFHCSSEEQEKKKNHLFHVGCFLIPAPGLPPSCPHCCNFSSFSAVNLMHRSRDDSENIEVPADFKSITGDMEDHQIFMKTNSAPKIVTISDSASFVPQSREMHNMISALATEKTLRLRPTGKCLYNPIRTGDVQKVMQLIGNGVNPNHKFKMHSNNTPLHVAAHHGNIGILHILIQAGALIDAVNDDLETPLIVAVEKNQLPIVRYLIHAGAQIDVKDCNGMTSFHIACKNGNKEIAEYLFNTGRIDVDLQDDGGWTALVWSCEHKHLELVKWLLGVGASTNLRDNEENTVLHWAAYSGESEIAELFLKKGCPLSYVNKHGDSALHIAAREDNFECVKLLVNRGAVLDQKNKNNQTPIMCCGNNSASFNYLMQAISSGALKIRRNQLEKHVVFRDISRGAESFPIQAVNEVDEKEFIMEFTYVVKNCFRPGVEISCTANNVKVCYCLDDCLTRECACTKDAQCWYDMNGCLTTDFDLVWPPVVYECSQTCHCPNTCMNRVVQRGMRCPLQLFRTLYQGWGVRTLEDLPKGAFVCEYVGELITGKEAVCRADDTYFFDLETGESDYCLDGKYYGNVARFLNHSCEPNMIAVKVFIDNQNSNFPRIAFFTLRPVKALEELCFDYGLDFWIVKSQSILCSCNTEACRYSKDSIDDTLQKYITDSKKETDDAVPQS